MRRERKEVGMYNLPMETLEIGRENFWMTVKEHFGNKAIDILEIGVFQAKCIQSLPEGMVNVKSYTGVDPYLGENDGYGGYWRNRDESSTVYGKAKEIFEKKNATLIRKTSKDYFNECDKEYDFIFVDADHRYYPALWDMCKWFHKVREGGLLMIDDYANVDTLDVTKATNAFFAICKRKIGRMGYCDRSFINKRKYIPCVSRCVYFEKAKNNSLKYYSVNLGSSARDMEVEQVANGKNLAIWADMNTSHLRDVVDLCAGYANCVIDFSGGCKENLINGIPVKHDRGKILLSDYFIIIPNLGTLEIEHILDQEGLSIQKDFFTLQLEKDKEYAFDLN